MDSIHHYGTMINVESAQCLLTKYHMSQNNFLGTKNKASELVYIRVLQWAQKLGCVVGSQSASPCIRTYRFFFQKLLDLGWTLSFSAVRETVKAKVNIKLYNLKSMYEAIMEWECFTTQDLDRWFQKTFTKTSDKSLDINN